MITVIISKEVWGLSINVIVHYPDDMEELEDRLCDVIAKILSKKLQTKPQEMEKLIELLENDDPRINL